MITKRFIATYSVLTLLLCISAGAQIFKVFDIQTSAYPLIRAKFYASDSARKQLTQLTPKDFAVHENAWQRKVTLIQCPSKYINGNVSLAMSIDVSSSMRWDNNHGKGFAPIQYVQISAKELAAQFEYPKSDVALQKCDDTPLLLQDFTTDTTLINKAIDNITLGQPNNFFNQLMGGANGLISIAKQGRNRRAAVIFTDAWYSAMDPALVQMCIDTCRKYDIRFFAAIYSRAEAQPSGISSSLRQIADSTNGLVIDDIVNENAAHDIAAALFESINQQGPCSIEWLSEPDCSVDRNVVIDCLANAQQYLSFYQAPLSSVSAIAIKPGALKFQKVPPGSSRDTSIVITAPSFDVQFSDVSSNNPAFSVTPTKFKLAANQSMSLTLHFSPVDSGMTYATIDFINDRCPLSMSVSGGFPGKISKNPNPRTLKLTHPNGGEEFVIGSDTIVTWTGVPRQEVVRLDYSADKGVSWRTISDSATGLRALWSRIPPPTSDSCLARVRQLGVDASATQFSKLYSYYNLEKFLGMSPDNQQLAFAQGNTIVILDTKSKALVAQLIGHTKPANAVSWDRSSQMLASVSMDSTVRLWDVQSALLLQTMKGHKGIGVVVAFDSAASRVASGAEDHSIRVWDVNTGKQLNLFNDMYETPIAIRWETSDSIACVAGNFSMQRYSCRFNTRLSIFYFGNSLVSWVNDADWSPDGSQLCYSTDSLLQIIDARNGTLIRTLNRFQSIAYSIRYSKDGKTIAAYIRDSCVCFFDAKTGALLQRSAKMQSFSSGLTWFSNSDSIVIGDYRLNVLCFSRQSGNLLWSYRSQSPGYNLLRWYRDNSTITMVSVDTTINFFDSFTGAQLGIRKSLGRIIRDYSFSKNDSLIAVTFQDTSITLFDRRTLSQVRKWSLFKKEYCASIAYSPDASILMAFSGSGRLYFYETQNYKLLDTISCAAMSPTWLSNQEVLYLSVSVNIQKQIYRYSASILDITTRKSTQILFDTLRAMRLIDASRSWNQVAIAFTSGLEIYDLRGKLLKTLSNSYVSKLSYSPDGSMLAVVYLDSSVYLYRSSDFSLLKHIPSVGAAIEDLQWSPDGQFLSAVHKGRPVLYDTWLIQQAAIQSDTSDAVFRIVAPMPEARDVDMGRVVVGRSRDSVMQLYVRNRGNYPFNLRSISISGADSAQFEVISTPPPYKIEANSGQDIEFTFRPNRAGPFIADVRIDVGSQVLVQRIRGTGVESALQLSTPIVDFGRVKVGQHKDSLVTAIVRNSGSTFVFLRSVDHVGPDMNSFSTLAVQLNRYLAPGDSCAISLRFQPSAVGRTNEQLAIGFDDLGSPLYALLLGEGISPGPQILSTVSAFPRLLCDTTERDSIIIKNIGAENLVIDSMLLEGSDSSSFRIMNSIIGDSIASGSSRTVYLDCSVSAARIYRARCRITSNSVRDSVIVLDFSVQKDVTGLSVLLARDSVGPLCPGDSVIRYIVIDNTGSTDNVFQLQCDSTLRPLATSISIPAGRRDSVAATLHADQSNGWVLSHCMVRDSLCGLERRIEFLTNVALPSLAAQAVYCRTSLGTTCVNDLVLHNNSDRDCRVDSITDPQPFTFVNLQLPLFIKAHDSLRLKMSYTAIDSLHHHVDLKFNGSPCSVAAMTTLDADAVALSAHISCAELYGQPGDSVVIPIIIKKQSNLSTSATSSFDMAISWNANMLAPLEASQSGYVNWTSSEVVRSIHFDCAFGADGDTIARIPCLVLLGNDTTAVLHLDSISCADKTILFSTEDGLFHCRPICRSGGARLIDGSSYSAIDAVSPQPAGDELSVMVRSVERSGVELLLVNAIGQVVKQQALDIRSDDSQTVSMNLHNIANGAYTLILKTPTMYLGQAILVMR